MLRLHSLSKQHFFLLLSLYVTQYLGLSFFMEALVAILRKNGMPLEQLGSIYLIGLFWVLKFCWAPAIDRYRLLPIGHYKGWLLVLQGLMVVLLLVVGRFSVTDDLAIILVLCLLIGFMAATQDVAVDTLAFSLLSVEDRGVGNGAKVAGGMLGYMLGGGLGLIAYAAIGWGWCLTLLAALTSVSFFQLLWFREKAHTVDTPNTGVYVRRFLVFWKARDKRRWLGLLLLYPLGICICYALIIPILVDLGWPLEKIGVVMNIIGALFGTVAAFASGWLIKRFGRRRILISMALGQALSILLLLLPVTGHNSIMCVAAAIGGLLCFYSPSATVLSTIMMDQTSKETPATDFAMQHSLYLLVNFIGSTIGMTLAGLVGYAAVIVLASLVSLSAMFASIKIYRPAQPDRKEMKEISLETVKL